MAGVETFRIRAVHVKRHAPKANTPQTVMTSNTKETKITSARSDPRKAATVSLVARKSKT